MVSKKATRRLSIFLVFVIVIQLLNVFNVRSEAAHENSALSFVTEGMEINALITHKGGLYGEKFFQGEEVSLIFSWKYDETFDSSKRISIDLPMDILAADGRIEKQVEIFGTGLFVKNTGDRFVLNFSGIEDPDETPSSQKTDNQFSGEPDESVELSVLGQPAESRTDETDNTEIIAYEYPLLSYALTASNDGTTGYVVISGYFISPSASAGSQNVRFAITDMDTSGNPVNVDKHITVTKHATSPVMTARSTFMSPVIDLSVSLEGRNSHAYDDDGVREVPVFYNGEKVGITVKWSAKSAIAAGTTAIIQLPSDSGVFFRSGKNILSASYDITMDSIKVGTAAVSAQGLITLEFTRNIEQSGAGEIAIDFYNLFTTNSERQENVSLTFNVSVGLSSGTVYAIIPILLASGKGVGIGDNSGRTVFLTQSIENNTPVSQISYWSGCALNVAFHGSDFGISAGDMIQLKLPLNTANNVGFAEIPRWPVAIRDSGVQIGTAAFTTVDKYVFVDIIFTSTISSDDVAFARVYGGFGVNMALVYADAFNPDSDTSVTIPVGVTGDNDINLGVIAQPRPPVTRSLATPPSQKLEKSVDYSTSNQPGWGTAVLKGDENETGLAPIRYYLQINRKDLFAPYTVATGTDPVTGLDNQNAYGKLENGQIIAFEDRYNYSYDPNMMLPVMKDTTIEDKLQKYEHNGVEKYYHFIDPYSLMITRYLALQSPTPALSHSRHEYVQDVNFVRGLGIDIARDFNAAEGTYNDIEKEKLRQLALTPYFWHNSDYYGNSSRRGLTFDEFVAQIKAENAAQPGAKPRQIPTITWLDENGRTWDGYNFPEVAAGSFNKDKIVGYTLCLGDVNDDASRKNDYNMSSIFDGVKFDSNGKAIIPSNLHTGGDGTWGIVNYSVPGSQFMNWAGGTNLSKYSYGSLFDFTDLNNRAKETHGKSFEYMVYYNAIPDKTMTNEMIDDMLENKNPTFKNKAKLTYYYEGGNGPGTGGLITEYADTTLGMKIKEDQSSSWLNKTTTGITIKKLNENNQPFAGVRFVLTKLGSPNTEISLPPTGVDGITAYTMLETGTYRLKEIAPDGYKEFLPVVFNVTRTVINDPRHENGINLTVFNDPADRFDITFTGDQNVITNIKPAPGEPDPTYSLELKKVGEDKPGGLSGAIFTLTRYDDASKYFVGDETIENQVSGTDGSLTFANLKPGYYVLTETNVLNGYNAHPPIEFSIVLGSNPVQIGEGNRITLNREGGNTIVNKLAEKTAEVPLKIRKDDNSNGFNSLSSYNFKLYYAMENDSGKADLNAPVKDKHGFDVVIANALQPTLALKGYSNTTKWNLVLVETKVPDEVRVSGSAYYAYDDDGYLKKISPTYIYNYSGSKDKQYPFTVVRTSESDPFTFTSTNGNVVPTTDGQGGSLIVINNNGVRRVENTTEDLYTDISLKKEDSVNAEHILSEYRFELFYEPYIPNGSNIPVIGRDGKPVVLTAASDTADFRLKGGSNDENGHANPLNLVLAETKAPDSIEKLTSVYTTENGIVKTKQKGFVYDYSANEGNTFALTAAVIDGSIRLSSNSVGVTNKTELTVNNTADEIPKIVTKEGLFTVLSVKKVDAADDSMLLDGFEFKLYYASADNLSADKNKPVKDSDGNPVVITSSGDDVELELDFDPGDANLFGKTWAMYLVETKTPMRSDKVETFNTATGLLTRTTTYDYSDGLGKEYPVTITIGSDGNIDVTSAGVSGNMITVTNTAVETVSDVITPIAPPPTEPLTPEPIETGEPETETPSPSPSASATVPATATETSTGTTTETSTGTTTETDTTTASPSAPPSPTSTPTDMATLPPPVRELTSGEQFIPVEGSADEFMILDAFGIPLGTIKVPVGKNILEMDESELLELLDEMISLGTLKPNPKTNDLRSSFSMVILVTSLLLLVFINLRVRFARYER